MPSSATLQTPSSPQIHNLPLDYFYSATLAPFYSALDTFAVVLVFPEIVLLGAIAILILLALRV